MHERSRIEESTTFEMPSVGERKTTLPSTGKNSRSWYRNRLIRWLFLMGTFPILLLGGVYVYRIEILTALGNGLVYVSAPQKCDVVVVLTGGGTSRLEKAIELYQADYASHILFTIPEAMPENAPYRDLYTTEQQMCAAVLKLQTIPSGIVSWSTSPFYSTYEEAVFLQNWMKEKNLQSAIVVSGYFQSRRAKWSMDQVFARQESESGTDPQPTHIFIVPATEEIYPVTRWWTHEEGIIAVENEYLKSGYYRMKSLFGTP